MSWRKGGFCSLLRCKMRNSSSSSVLLFISTLLMFRSLEAFHFSWISGQPSYTELAWTTKGTLTSFGEHESSSSLSSSSSPSSSSSSNAHPLQDLIDQGVLTIVKRRVDYKDRKPDYVEPEEIFLVGTAHTSQESANAVARVIHEVKPCSVVLEMCKSRSGLTSLNDSQLLDEVRLPLLIRTALFGRPSADNPALERSLQLAGSRGALVLQFGLTWAVKELAGLLNVRFGEEFRAARKASEEVGAQVILGDRPIELTLRRAWQSMRPEERGLVLLAMMSLVFGLRKRPPGRTNSSPTAIKAIEEGAASQGGVLGSLGLLEWLSLSSSSSPSSPSSSLGRSLFNSPTSPLSKDRGGGEGRGDALELTGYQGTDAQLVEALERFGDTFPYLCEALICERDRYLAWASKRSKAVNGSKKVVTVMGQLHVKGVVEALQADNGGNLLTFKTVARLPEVNLPTSSAEGGKGVKLSSPYRRLIGELMWSWLIGSIPRFGRDVMIGTVVAQGAQVVWKEIGPEVMMRWQQVLEVVGEEGGLGGLMPPF